MEFILLSIGLCLILYSQLFMKKAENSPEGKSFNAIFANEKLSDNKVKEEIVLLRKTLGESLNDIQQDMLKINKKIERLQEEKMDKIREDSGKTKEIKKLLSEGLNIDEISRQLSISKGEIILVQQMHKIQEKN